MRVLAGDIGGTNARLAVFEISGERRRRLLHRVFESDRHDGLTPIVQEFLAEAADALGETPRSACFGVACPVVDDTCELPNLDWVIERRELARSIDVEEVRLINDFDAVGHGLSCLAEEDVAELQSGRPRSRAPIALIGAGTGLGQGYLTWDEGLERYRVHSSEGGHVDFAPRDELQAALWAFLKERHGHVSYERVLSGPGIVNVYEFLVSSGRGEDDPEVRRVLDGAEPDEAAEAISRRAGEGGHTTSRRALGVFVSVFGAQAGNLALTVQPGGGLYLGGGIAPDVLDALRERGFLDAFRAKGRMRDLMPTFPVRVILNEDVGLLGAAVAATYRDL